MQKFFVGFHKSVFNQTAINGADIEKTPTLAQEFLSLALSEGKNFAVLGAGQEQVAKALQAEFLSRVEALVATASEEGIEALEDLHLNGHICKEVFEYVEDLVVAKEHELKSTIEVKAEVFIEEGANITEEQVREAMQAQGLVIGGTCETPVGQGNVLSFEATNYGTMVIVNVEGEFMKYLSNAVKGQKAIQIEEAKKMVNNANNEVVAAVQAENNTQNKGEVTNMENTNKEVMAMINAFKKGDIAAIEMTPEARELQQEMEIQAMLASHNTKDKKTVEQEEKVKAAAVSASAQAVLKMAGATPTAPAQNTPTATPQVEGAPVVTQTRPAAGRRMSVNAAALSNNQNQTTGGNNTMTNNNTTQASATTRQSTAPAASASTRQSTASRFAVNPAALGSTSALPANADGLFEKKASAANAGWAGVASRMEEFQNEYVGRNAAGGADFVWYLNEATKYADVLMTLDEIREAGMKNDKVGITDIKFYNPADVAASNNRQANENDFVIIEVFFGLTSYTFTFRRGVQHTDGRPYIYSTNIARRQSNSGNRFCEFVSSRRTDKMMIVKQADGTFREARKVWANGEQVVHAEDAPFAFEVGGNNWVNVAPNYGIKVGQAVFIQLMLIVDDLSGLKAFRESAQN